ncbi:hypothetical protein [Geomesophilobacter sediminis]|uniref:Uncharacterized protein n=1 Tax=Geomesophilobacter sediminis TaxID=2798584 RepID=A0A8J7LXH5_9BACT|nr:hypothetical protein [Geomesophilobacter sediminis]MBJ6723172.1 hypothetical protein [Geomesophilobacter sediminis]
MVTSHLKLHTMVRDKRLLFGVPTLVIFLLILVDFCVISWQKALTQQRQQNLLISAPQDPSRRTVNWDMSVGENLEQYLPYLPDSSMGRLTILAGMSQMYAINDQKPGDRIIVEHLDAALSPSGMRAFGLAAPNMHNEEALLMLLTTLSIPKAHPNYFIYGVCFDKFRNVDLRPGLQRLLGTRPELAQIWRDAALRYRNRYPKAAEKMLASLAAVESTQKKGEVTFEERLRSKVASLLPLVAARQDLNAVTMGQLFELRNWMFHITPQSKRPILQSRYQLNQEFLEMIADVANENHVQPIYYVIPLNPLARNPYVPSQYAAFKVWLQQLCQQKAIPFANLEGTVPSKYWGEFMGGPDYKHFRAEGHAITAQAILREFGPLLGNGGRAQ